MRDEVLKGIFGGLLAVITVVSIGSFIGSSMSHGPEGGHAEEPAAASAEGEADQGEAAEGEAAEGEAADGEATE